MSCSLSQGIATLDCADGIGGTKSVRFTEKANISSITKTGAQVTAITMADGKQFFYFALDQETVDAKTAGGQTANGTTPWVHTIVGTWRKISVSKTNLMKILIQQPQLVAIVENNNGQYLLYGYNLGGKMTQAGTVNGIMIGDKNGYDWGFTANDPDDAYLIDSSLITALDSPAS